MNPAVNGRAAAAKAGRLRRFGPVEYYLLIQTLSAGLLLLPGMQQVRIVIRTLPYLAGLFALVFLWKKTVRSARPAGAALLFLGLVWLGVSVFHPATQLRSGVAQVMFQISIAAPLFWGALLIRDELHLERLLRLYFLASAAGTIVGLLQVYYPETFLPPDYNTFRFARNAHLIQALTFVGANGQQIVRPPGLSDMPGGAGVSAMVTGVLGIALAVRPHEKLWQRCAELLLAAIGFMVLYLTQVRSLLLVMLVAVVVYCIILVLQGRRLAGVGGAMAAGALVVFSFMKAVEVGGTAVASRFGSLYTTGVMNSYQQNRGLFLTHTLQNLLPQYPFGAGLGRWGVMFVYFGDPFSRVSPPIWVEIQLTGWLIDGGVLLWILYGGAALAAVYYSARIAVRGSTQVQWSAASICIIQIITLGMSFAGPVFNTQLGAIYWLFSAALFGAVLRLHGSGGTEIRAARVTLPRPFPTPLPQPVG